MCQWIILSGCRGISRTAWTGVTVPVHDANPLVSGTGSAAAYHRSLVIVAKNFSFPGLILSMGPILRIEFWPYPPSPVARWLT